MKKKYSVQEHPSDMGLKAWGDSASELFAHAAEGMFSIMSDMRKIKPDKEMDLSIREDLICGYDHALVAWLEELIYLHETEKMLLREFSIQKLDTEKGIVIEAGVRGEQIDYNRHEIKVGIKAVTYHGLKVVKNKIWKAQLIFDV